MLNITLDTCVWLKLLYIDFKNEDNYLEEICFWIENNHIKHIVPTNIIDEWNRHKLGYQNEIVTYFKNKEKESIKFIGHNAEFASTYNSAELEKRVGEEVRRSLKTYQDTNGYYPFASQLGTTNNFACEPALLSGFLPANHQSCAYTYSAATTSTLLACINTLFDTATTAAETVRFDRTSGGTFSGAFSGLCNRNSPTRCTCTGIGSCGTAAIGVSCTASGCSSTGILGSYRVSNGKFRFRSAGCNQTTFPTKTNSCSNSNAVITCSAINGNFSYCNEASFTANLPAWFNQNQWGSFVYYQMTRPASPTSFARVLN